MNLARNQHLPIRVPTAIAASLCLLMTMRACPPSTATHTAPPPVGAQLATSGKTASTGNVAKPSAKPTLVWADAQTGAALFNSDDLTGFDWEKQVLGLKLDAALDLLAWCQGAGQHRAFVVKDAHGVIYEGHYVLPICSMAFPGPVMHWPAAMGASKIPYTINMVDGYPGSVQGADDSRQAPRLRQALARAGKLGALDGAGAPHQTIQRVASNWVRRPDAPAVRVDYFPQTFRRGSKARAHFIFSGASDLPVHNDDIAIEMVLIAHDQPFRAEACIEGIPVDVMQQRVYVCKVDLWEPLEGYEGCECPAGMCSITASLKVQAREGDRRRVTKRWDFRPVDICVQ